MRPNLMNLNLQLLVQIWTSSSKFKSKSLIQILNHRWAVHINQIQSQGVTFVIWFNLKTFLISLTSWLFRNSLVVISCAVMAGYIDQDCIDIMKDKNQVRSIKRDCIDIMKEKNQVRNIKGTVDDLFKVKCLIHLTFEEWLLKITSEAH